MNNMEQKPNQGTQNANQNQGGQSSHQGGQNQGAQTNKMPHENDPKGDAADGRVGNNIRKDEPTAEQKGTMKTDQQANAGQSQGRDRKESA